MVCLITVCIVYRKFKTLLQEFWFVYLDFNIFRLHCLTCTVPIRYRITFKICILTYQAYHRTAPSYLCDFIVPYVNTRSLRSNIKCLIKLCKLRLRSYGERCFKYAGPQYWNTLPIHIRKSSSLSIFKTQQKTYLFRLAYPSI